jgi:GT2 family glycosyltransferase
MYAEEMDLCQKVRQAGWKVGYVPDGSVIHFGGQSTKKKGDGFSDVMIRDSVFRLLRKFRGHAYAYSYRLGMLVNAVLRLLALSGVAAVSGRMYRRNYVIHAWRKWRNIARWTLFGTGRGEQVGVLASNHALGVKS